MAEYTEVADETLDRLQAMFRSIEEEFEKLQQRVNDRADEFSKETQRRVDRMGKELRKSPLYKRAESFRKEANKQLEKNVDSVLGALNIATRSDIKKLERKVNQLSKKLKEMEKPEPAPASAAQA